MKKLIYCIIISSLILSLTACGKTETSTNTTSATTTSQQDVNTEKINFDEYIDTEMPPVTKNGENSGGDAAHNYICPLINRAASIPSEVIDIIGESEFLEWAESRKCNVVGGDISDTCNLYAVIKRFNVDAEKVTEILKKYEVNGVGDETVFTESELAAIRSKDPEKFVEAFASDFSVVVDGKIYSQEWLYKHTTAAYEKAKIPADVIKSKREIFKTDNYISEDAQKAFQAKLDKYINS